MRIRQKTLEIVWGILIYTVLLFAAFAPFGLAYTVGYMQGVESKIVKLYTEEGR